MPVVSKKRYVAIQLFGHVRTYRETAKSFFRNLVEPIKNAGYEVHIFVHTWDEIDSLDSRTSYPKDMSKAGVNLTDEQIALFKAIYNPSRIVVDKQLILSDSEAELENAKDILWYKNLAHSFCGVNKLRQEYERKNNLKYDLVICTRPDIEFIQPFTNIFEFRDRLGLWEYFENIDNCFFTSYIVKGRCVTAYRHLIAGIDLFLVASTHVMNEINKWEDNFKKYNNLKPERAITEIFTAAGFIHNVINYEKDKCWRIHRFGEKFTFGNKLANSIYKRLLPILIHSPLYLSDICFCSTKYSGGSLKGNVSWFINKKIK